MVNIDKRTKILHITPHLGGGVGSVLLNYFSFIKNDEYFKHSAVCLDYANENSISVANDIGLELNDNMHSKNDELLEMIGVFDIILVHFWNHPLLYDFLVRNKLPESRVIFWSHVSGLHSPYVFSEKLLDYPDLFVATTPISFESEVIKNYQNKNRIKMVWSTAGVEHTKNISKKKHEGFNIGYIGTVDYSKMSPDFLEICQKIDIPESKFIVCGGSKHLEIQQQANELGLSHKVEFTGIVKNINAYLAEFDVLGYPLAGYHYGTCDQVLQESMAAGIVPVVLNNPMENYMVIHNETGLVARDIAEYVMYIKQLYQDSVLLDRLSENAKKYACEKFSLENLKNDWDKVFNELLLMPKASRQWDIVKKDIFPKDIFLESLGEYGEDFVSYFQSGNLEKIKELAKLPCWQSESKGSIHQYATFLKDIELQKLSNEMR